MDWSRAYRFYSLIFVLCITLVTFLPVHSEVGFGMYARPVGFMLIAGFVLFRIPRVYAPGGWSLKDMTVGYACSGAIIYLALSFLLGVLLKELAASPYDHSLYGIFYHFLSILPCVSAKELVREYGMGTAWRNRRFRHWFIGAVTVFMAVLEINYSKAGTLTDAKTWFIFLAKDVAPLFSRNILLSVLVFYGGAKAGIFYSGMIQIFQRIFPFLPNLSWLADSVIGIAFPVFYAVYIQDRCTSAAGEHLPDQEKGVVRQTVVLGLSVVFCWFCVGVFSLYPSVVLTGSMEPDIKPGDVVLIKKIQQEEMIYRLKSGDVITFTRGPITITHRITKVLRDEAGNVSFQTKGDNNRSPDNETVDPQDLKGIVVGTIPKAGIPILVLKSGEEIPEGVTDDE